MLTDNVINQVNEFKTTWKDSTTTIKSDRALLNHTRALFGSVFDLIRSVCDTKLQVQLSGKPWEILWPVEHDASEERLDKRVDQIQSAMYKNMAETSTKLGREVEKKLDQKVDFLHELL